MRQQVVVGLLLITAAVLSAQVRAPRTLSIYMIDVEGGNATLFVSPTRESLLIDTGHGGPAGARCRRHAG
jgi:competence protein ComEC